METMVITDAKQVSEIARMLRGTYSTFNAAIRKEEVLAKKPVPQALR